MDSQIEASRSKPPVLKRAVAGVVLVVAAALIIKLAIGFVMAIFWTVVVIAAIIAVLWALKTIL
jgi:uncharacterized membrane protein YgaE (UPF0421/DUF939 family)